MPDVTECFRHISGSRVVSGDAYSVVVVKVTVIIGPSCRRLYRDTCRGTDNRWTRSREKAKR